MGNRIRQVRNEQSVSLAQLADRTGLSKSYLSKIEREMNEPSISAALSIAEALRVEVGELFSDTANGSPLTIDRTASEAPAGALQALHSARIGKLISPFVLRPDTALTASGKQHKGEEMVFVHSGSIELTYQSDSYQLGAGESAYLDASFPHRIRSLGEEEAVVLVISIQSDT